jgi:hydroxyethylthiazole kinase
MPAEGDEMRSPDSPAASPGNLPRTAADVLARLRARAPRVHCITNNVAQNFTANVLLAAGAIPSMTISAEEIGHFVAGADALLVNLGTFDSERAAAIDIAVGSGKPWVLDPVLVDRSPPRAGLARALIAKRPNVVRLNGAEFSALGGGAADGAGVAAFARQSGVTIALSGANDLVGDGARLASIANGDPLMAKVTAMGCAASALIAACLAVERDAFSASIAGLLMIGIAGQLAGAKASGPGSFAVAILDELQGLDGSSLIERAKVSS